MKKIFLIALTLSCTAPAFAEDALPTPKAQPGALQNSSTESDSDGEDEVPQQTLNQISVLISSQIRPCWKIPATPNTQPLEAVINIDKSGNLKFVQFNSDVQPDQKVLAKSVQEAIADPKCNPIKNLPPDNLYYVWQNLALLFAPKN